MKKFLVRLMPWTGILWFVSLMVGALIYGHILEVANKAVTLIDALIIFGACFLAVAGLFIEYCFYMQLSFSENGDN